MRMLVILAALGGALTACSVSFDPAGQPCDIRGRCLAGYHCDATRHCVTGPGSSGASGTSGGSGSSTGGSSGTTGSGACAGMVCPIEESCVSRDGGGAGCQRALYACATDTDCTSGSCLRNGSALGFCSAGCVPDGGASSCPRGYGCVDGLVGTRGNSASRCLPLPAPHNCSRPADCAGTGFSCLPFDDTQALGNSDPSLPIGFCDAPIAGGAAVGVSCTAARRCASGLCAATASTGVGVCLDGCAMDSDCPTGHACTEVRSIESTRLTRACTASVTTCQLCPAGCGPDAPDCDSATGRCVLFCRPGDKSACGPASRTCQVFTAGTNPFCSADGGAGC